MAILLIAEHGNDHLSDQTAKALSAALSSITAAVVGCVFNLALRFSIHVVFSRVETRRLELFSWELPIGGDGVYLRWLEPDLSSLQLDALLVALFAAVMLFVLKRGLLPTLVSSVAFGAVLWALKK